MRKYTSAEKCVEKKQKTSAILVLRRKYTDFVHGLHLILLWVLLLWKRHHSNAIVECC